MKKNLWEIYTRDFLSPYAKAAALQYGMMQVNMYIDCMGGYGVALVGHRNERVVKALQAQLEEIITVHSSLYNTIACLRQFLKKRHFSIPAVDLYRQTE